MFIIERGISQSTISIKRILWMALAHLSVSPIPFIKKWNKKYSKQNCSTYGPLNGHLANFLKYHDFNVIFFLFDGFNDTFIGNVFPSWCKTKFIERICSMHFLHYTDQQGHSDDSNKGLKCGISK